MNMKSFIKSSRGKWIVQRTTYDFQSKKIWNLKSYVTVEQLLNRKIVRKFFAQDNINNYTVLSLIWGRKVSSYNIIVCSNDHKLEIFTDNIVQLNKTCNMYLHKMYYFNSCLLNIRFSDANFCICEKLWFVSKNLALGISITRYGSYYVSISFESKIRM